MVMEIIGNPFEGLRSVGYDVCIMTFQPSYNNLSKNIYASLQLF